MKHLIIRLTTLALMLTTLIPAKAQQTQWHYDGLFYYINDDGTCSVVSTLKTGEIVIPQVAVIEGKNYTVTAILEGAFQTKDKITSIVAQFRNIYRRMRLLRLHGTDHYKTARCID